MDTLNLDTVASLPPRARRALLTVLLADVARLHGLLPPGTVATAETNAGCALVALRNAYGFAQGPELTAADLVEVAWQAAHAEGCLICAAEGDESPAYFEGFAQARARQQAVLAGLRSPAQEAA